ncbi:HTH domain-containing protein [Haloarcula sp. AONF1]
MQAPEAVLNATTANLRLELFVRSLAPETARPQQEAVIERLRDLADEVADTELYVTGDCVCPSTVAAETETGRFLLDRYEAFEEWADESGVELVGFRNRCVDSSMTGETVTGIQFPRLTLAVFADDQLRFVAPAIRNGTETTVADAQDEIERAIVQQ